MIPTASLTASSLTRAASSQPAATPIIAEGTRMTRLCGEKSRLNAQTLTQSCTMSTGSTIAAPLTGEITSDSNGMASELSPVNPPFDRPSRMTAGTATR